MQDMLYYQRSGRMGALGLPLMLAMGMGAGVLLGVPYAYAVHYCPLIYINFLITLAFASAIGIAVNVAARQSKVRNLPALLLAGALSGCAAEYVAWVGYVHVVAEDPVWPWSPSELYTYMEIINAQGVWSIKSSTPTGYVLAAVWLVEAALFVGMAIYLPYTTIGTTPFNEQTGTWADQVVTHGPFLLTTDDRSITNRLEAGDVGAITELTPAQPGARYFYQCLITTCAGDDDFTLLTIQSVRRGTDKNGKEESTNRNVLRHLLISTGMRKAIEAKAAEPSVAEKSAVKTT